MNFEDLKNKWDKQEIEPMNIAADVWQKRTNTAIDKVRKNMRMDFWAGIVMFTLVLSAIIITPMFIELQTIFLTVLWLFFIVMTAISSFFIVKFVRFYRSSYNLVYDSYHNLMWFYYELRYFVDFYQAFAFVSLNLGIGAGLTIGFIAGTMKRYAGQETAVSQGAEAIGIVGLIALIVFVIIGWFFLRFMVEAMYGRYLKQIKKNLDDLLEE